MIARSIVDLLPLIARLMRREADVASGGKLSLPQFRILRFIRDGERNVGALAVLHGVSQPAMSALVERLARDGYLTRERDPADLRKQSLTLTKAGESALAKTSEKIEERLAAVVDEIAPAARARLDSTLVDLHEAFAPETPAPAAPPWPSPAKLKKSTPRTRNRR